MKIKLVVASLVFFFSNQSASDDKVLYEEILYDKPKIGVESEVYLGDRMLTQATGSWRECITMRTTLQKTQMGYTATYKSNEPMCKMNLNDKNYMPTYEMFAGYPKAPVVWKPKGKRSKICVKVVMGTSYCVKKLPEDAVLENVTFIYSDNTFQQSLEYAGRSGDVLKFNYSEFTGGFAREAFSREFQVDLADGNVAAYKGAIVEVINASNLKIKYKVIRNFSEQ
ncbi:hypothetical protein OAR36_13155 [Pseudomonadales bacterium]|nr:hypothetical protein [Pseudomonadales bacterium]